MILTVSDIYGPDYELTVYEHNLAWPGLRKEFKGNGVHKENM